MLHSLPIITNKKIKVNRIKSEKISERRMKMFNGILKKQKDRIEFLEEEKRILEAKQQEFIDEAKEMNKLYEESFNDSTGNTGEEKKKRINAIIYKFKKEMNI